MRQALILFAVVAYAFADDPSISIALQSEPMKLLSPGATLEYGQRFGRRSDVGVITALTEAPERDWQVGVYLRPQWSASLDSQWYPQLSVIWQSDTQQWQPWLGVGLQHRILPEASLLGELHWLTQSNNLQLRLGVRFWLDRINQLDARVRDAQPIGATWAAGDPLSPDTKVVLISEPLVNQEAARLEPKPSYLEEPSVAKTTTSELVRLEPKKMEPMAANYLHLGLFRQAASAQSLLTDVALTEWPLGLWYDPTRQAYRLLAGPLNSSQVLQLKARLEQAGIAAFDYQKPEELEAYEP